MKTRLRRTRAEQIEQALRGVVKQCNQAWGAARVTTEGLAEPAQSPSAPPQKRLARYPIALAIAHAHIYEAALDYVDAQFTDPLERTAIRRRIREELAVKFGCRANLLDWVNARRTMAIRAGGYRFRRFEELNAEMQQLIVDNANR